MPNTNKLKLIGYWNNFYSNRWVHPRILIDFSWEVKNRTKIINYLQKAMVYSISFGTSPNRFFRGPNMIGDSEYTDGTWVWPSGLASYVELYHIRLPDEFIQHLQQQQFKPCVDDNTIDLPWYEKIDSVEVDLTYWEEWCKKEKKKLNFFKRVILNISFSL